MKESQRTLLVGLVLLFVITFTSGLVYFIAQQSIRLGANSDPARLATETTIKLDSGISPKDALPAEKADLTKSLEPFVMVFDSSKNLVATSAMMGSGEPAYPTGVLDAAAANGESRVSWQPQQGLRFATVAMPYNGGTVVAGASLKEPEALIDTIGRLVLYAWTGGVVFAAFALFIITHFMKKRNTDKT